MKLIINSNFYKDKETFNFTGINGNLVKAKIEKKDDLMIIDVNDDDAKKLLPIAIIDEYDGKVETKMKDEDEMPKVEKEDEDDMKKVVIEKDDMKKVVEKKKKSKK